MPRNKKGSVTVETVGKVLRLRFTHKSVRYCLNLHKESSDYNMLKARQLSIQVELDILDGTFDLSLDRYRDFLGSIESDMTEDKKPVSSLLSTLAEWVKLNNHHQHLTILKWLTTENAEWESVVRILTEKIDGSSITWKIRRRVIVRAIEHLPDRAELISRLEKIKCPSPKPTRYLSTRQPFTVEEINLILETMATDYPYYSLYTEVLFVTGCRPGEVIALRPMDFNSDFIRVTISSSISRSKTSSMAQVRKGTKTGNIRTLSLPVDLAQRLKEKSKGIDRTECMFQHLGKPISAQMFLRPWKLVLTKLGLPYRVPYAARHTMASRALESTGNPVAVAHLMGHSSPVMVLSRYGHVITPPELPSIKT